VGDIISFVGQKGGTGKSTLARAFAVEAAKHDKSVLIADRRASYLENSR
jgi:cellulose biosynthesis protein BcsQ